MKSAIFSELQLQRAIGELRAMFKASGYLRITASDSKPRSLNQNALAAVWYAQVARELGEDTPEGVKCEAKLRWGVPILRAEDEEFRAVYDGAIKNTMTYEQKLAVMRFFPVTSLMNTDQLSRYLQDMQKGYAGRVQLEFPEEWRNAA